PARQPVHCHVAQIHQRVAGGPARPATRQVVGLRELCRADDVLEDEEREELSRAVSHDSAPGEMWPTLSIVNPAEAPCNRKAGREFPCLNRPDLPAIERDAP